MKCSAMSGCYKACQDRMASSMRMVAWCSYLERWSWRSWAAIAALEREVETLKHELERLRRENLSLANMVEKKLKQKQSCRKLGQIGRKRIVLKKRKKRAQK